MKIAMANLSTYSLVKRSFDCVFAVCALVLAAPILAAVTLAVRSTLGTPVIFRQQRPGLDGKPFELLKFCTMTNKCDVSGRPLPDHERLTQLGMFLRRWSLDELPQFWNVLRGDMSLVGPRPLLMEYLDRYTPEQTRRHDVRPGITGWAQVHGRNAISWEEKFELDAWYVQHASLALDMRILMSTVLMVLRREGISAASHVTMLPFKAAEPEGRKLA